MLGIASCLLRGVDNQTIGRHHKTFIFDDFSPSTALLAYSRYDVNKAYRTKLGLAFLILRALIA